MGILGKQNLAKRSQERPSVLAAPDKEQKRNDRPQSSKALLFSLPGHAAKDAALACTEGLPQPASVLALGTKLL